MGLKLNILSPDDKLMLTYKGIFDSEDMLHMGREWFEERGFEFHEHTYKAYDPSRGEAEFFWSGFRNDTEILRIWIELYFHYYDVEAVDVIKNKKKKTIQRGRIKILFHGYIEIDYKGKYETSKFLETLRDFYWKTIYFKRIQMYGDKIEYELHGLHEKFKQKLEMSTKGNQFHDVW